MTEMFSVWPHQFKPSVLALVYYVAAFEKKDLVNSSKCARETLVNITAIRCVITTAVHSVVKCLMRYSLYSSLSSVFVSFVVLRGSDLQSMCFPKTEKLHCRESWRRARLQGRIPLYNCTLGRTVSQNKAYNTMKKLLMSSIWITSIFQHIFTILHFHDYFPNYHS